MSQTVHQTPSSSSLTPRGLSRRGLLSAGATAAAGSVLAACGVGGAGGGATTPAKVQGKVTVLFFTSTEPAIDRMKKQEASFREKYPEVQLTTEAQPTAFTQALTTRLAAGTPPDVHWIGADFWRFVGQGAYVDLGPIIAKDRRFNLKEYYPAATQAYTWQDKMRALAYGVNTHTMTYNKRLLQQEGMQLPTASWTIQQFTDMARRLTKEGEQAGFGNWPSLVTTPFVFGGSVWDKGFTRSVFDSPETTAAFEWLHEIQYSSRKVYPTPEMLQGTNLNNLMGQGKIGFFSTGRFSVPVLKNFTDLDWDMVVYPSGPTGKKATFLSVEGYAMTTPTKDQEAAFKLMEHLCGREAQEQFYLKEGNVIPAIKAVAESPGFSSPVPGKNHKAHLDSLEFGVQPNNHPVDPEVLANIITPAWNDVVAGKMQPREMTRQVATRLTEALNTWKAQNKS